MQNDPDLKACEICGKRRVDIVGVSGSTCETLQRLCSEPDDSDGLPATQKCAPAAAAAVATAAAAAAACKKVNPHSFGTITHPLLPHSPPNRAMMLAFAQCNGEVRPREETARPQLVW